MVIVTSIISIGTTLPLLPKALLLLLFLLPLLPPLLEPVEQFPTLPSDAVVVSLRGGQLDIFHPRLVEGVSVAAGPGVVLGARHHVEHGRAARGPMMAIRPLNFVFVIIAIIVTTAFVRMEPPDGAPLVQSVHSKPDRVGQLGTAVSIGIIVVGIVPITTATATDKGNHGIEQAAGGDGNFVGASGAHDDSGALLLYYATLLRKNQDNWQQARQ